MKKTAFSFLLLAGILLLAGCQKEARIGGKDAIQFSASTPGTKTVYSGDQTGAKEGIYWIGWDDVANQGDIIRIYSNKAVHRYNKDANTGAPQPWADYVIKEVSNDGALSKGKIDNVPGDGTGNGLIWGAAGDYEFYAVYPNLVCADGNSGVLAASIPQTQNIVVSSDAPNAPDMSYAVMTAFQKQTTTVEGEGEAIKLEFNPAFTAFQFTFNSEIPVEVHKFSLSSAGTAPKISGNYTIKYVNGQPAYDCSGAGGQKIDVVFSSETSRYVTIDSDHPLTFTVFALPQKLSGLSIEFTIKARDWSATETRTLKLNYKNGESVEFDPLIKHRIEGTIQAGGIFKSITLNGEVLDWIEETVETNSDNSPQSTQFSISGEGVYNLYDKYGDAYKTQRQTWVLGDNIATVSFKVFSPLDGTYEIVPYILIGDTESAEISSYFTVTGNLTGTIGVLNPEDHQTHTATRVSFTVQALQAGAQLFFKTYVTDTDGNTSSLDSETQLFDSRGYHYFRYDDPVNP